MYNEILKKINNSEISTIVFDFDYTLTTQNSESSIGVFSKYLPESYYNKKKVLDFFTNIALSSMFYKLIWYLKLKLLFKYNAKSMINKINIYREFRVNKSAIDILKNAIDNDVDVIIYSSGLEEIITKFLKINNIDDKKVDIKANNLRNVDFSSIITPKKKKLNFSSQECVLLIGDKIDDLKIVNNAKKILLKNDELIEVS